MSGEPDLFLAVLTVVCWVVIPTWAVARCIHVGLEITSPNPSPWWGGEPVAAQNPRSGLAHMTKDTAP